MITAGSASGKRKKTTGNHSIDLAKKSTQVRKPPKKLSFAIDIVSKDEKDDNEEFNSQKRCSD